MIDLAEMKGIAIDPDRATATAEGGVLWGELNDAAAEHGLAVTGGAVSGTGIAGYTLGGGLGWLMAKYGLAADNLLAVELVTAEGDVLHVDAASHPDLFWALRGGGGNFGVATSFTYRCTRSQTVVGGLIAHPIDAAPELLRFYRDAVADASDDLTVFAGLVHAPDGSGAKLAALVVFHTGDAAEAERELEPFKAWGSPLVVEVGPMPYPVMNTLLDAGFPAGVAQLLAVELHARAPRRADRHRRRAVRRRPVADDGDPVRALPRRGDARRRDRDRGAAPRRGLEPAHPVRLDRPGRHRRRTSPGRRETFAAMRPHFGTRPLAQLPRRRPGRRRHPRRLRPELRPARARSSGATTPTTSSTSTTTSRRSTGDARALAIRAPLDGAVLVSGSATAKSSVAAVRRASGLRIASTAGKSMRRITRIRFLNEASTTIEQRSRSDGSGLTAPAIDRQRHGRTSAATGSTLRRRTQERDGRPGRASPLRPDATARSSHDFHGGPASTASITASVDIDITRSVHLPSPDWTRRATRGLHLYDSRTPGRRTADFRVF